MNKKLLLIIPAFIISACNSEDKIYIEGKDAFCSGEGLEMICSDVNQKPITGMIKMSLERKFDTIHNGNFDIAEFKKGKFAGMFREYRYGKIRREVRMDTKTGKIISEKEFDD